MSRGQYTSDPYMYPGGGVAAGVQVRVVRRGTFVLVPLYFSMEGGSRNVNPLRTRGDGRVSFWIDPGSYDCLANGVRTPFDVDSSDEVGGGSIFIYHQILPSASSVIDHNLGIKPTVTVIDGSGNELNVEVDYPSDNRVTLTLSQPRTFTVYCRS